MDEIIEQKLADKLARKSQKTPKGFIDSIQGGFITGWALDPSSGKQTPYVSLEVNGTIYGRAPANIYRKDLEQAGITNGCHGFILPIDELLKEKSPAKAKIRINTSVIAETQIDLAPQEGNFWFGFEKLENCDLFGSLISESFQGEKKLSLLREGVEIASSYCAIKKGHNAIKLTLPVGYFDDDYHLLSLGVAGFPFSLWTSTLQLKGITTPWDYLKTSYKEPGFLAFSQHAKFRYDSLRRQSEAIASGKLVGVGHADLYQAHDEVVKGWKDRTTFPPLKLPKVEQPEVSIIIPAYNKLELTYHAVASIILAFNEATYEVIVADDHSEDQTKDIGNIIENIVHVRHKENLRFLLSCNRAAKKAKGDYLVFLNNDTEVTSFWLDELILPFKQANNVGATGAKLLHEDGRLQDAGGIIWGSGKPWNVGNGANALAPEYNYTREPDYLTGAALCIAKSVWDNVRGFSEEYAPCYYEDTDIAFKVRELGLKTLYCPFSQVIHFEGQSHGRDITKGLKQYQAVNAETFKAKWFAAYKDHEKEGLNLGIEKDRNVDHRVLVLDYATPNLHADAGSYAAIQEMELLVSLGMKVTFVPENMAHMGKLTHELQRKGIEVLYAPFYSSVFDVVEKRIGEFDSVYITRFSVAEKYLDAIKARSEAKIVFNNADLHFLRELRAAQSTQEYSKEQALLTRGRELSVMNQVDAILSYNDIEHAVLQSHDIDADKIFHCPWVAAPKKIQQSFAERHHIGFIGGFNHHPNVEAVKFFAKDVMPLINKKKPGIKFYVYGSNPSDSVKALASDSVVIKGWVPSLDEVFISHRIMVAPLLSGAGIKGKVVESMSYGCPQVLTKFAAEATGLSHKISAWIQDDAEGLAEGVLTLYDNENLWHKFQEHSAILVNELFTREKGLAKMAKAFAHVGIYTKIKT